MMATDTEKTVHLTQWEWDKELEHAVMKAKLADMDLIIPKLFTAIESLTKQVGEIPIEIIKCKNSFDAEVKEYMHGKFITDMDLQAFESKLEKRMSVEMDLLRRDLGGVKTTINRAVWIVTGVVATATSVAAIMFFILTHTNIVIT